MGTYKETVIPEVEEDQEVGICEECGTDIHTGQIVWKVGSDMYCSQSCLQSGLKIITLRI